jgi:hypothetical protein
LESGPDGTSLRNNAMTSFSEYMKLQAQYLQLTKLLDTNIDLIKQRQALITKAQSSLDSSENNYNIKRDIAKKNVEDAKRWEHVLSQLYFWVKFGGWILIAIVIGLIFLIDIHKVL